MTRLSLSKSESWTSPPGSPVASTKGFSRVMILLNVLFLGILYMRMPVSPTGATSRELWAIDQWMTTPKTATDTRNNNPSNICPDALRFFDQSSLEKSIQRSQNFHHRGGNLKHIQLLLDSHIDSTVQKLGLKFLPKDNPTSPTQDVSKHLSEYFATHFDERGGYGRPLPGNYEPKHPLLLEDRYVEVADPTNSKERWDASLGPMGPNCTNLLEIGETNRDGTKWMCQPLIQEQEPQEDCHIISIGGNDNWHFEETVRREMPHCTTHTFDCTLKGGVARRKPNDERIHFYNYCIDDHNHADPHGREFLTYFDILLKAQLNAPPLLFKIDVEGFEYDIFSHMIQKADVSDTEQLQGKPLSWWLPQQIGVELHWATRMTGVKWMPRTRTSAEIALLSNMMFTGGGYQPIFEFWIPQCPSCIEILYFRTQC